MKIYQEPKPPYLMRINIKRQGEKTEHLTLCETAQEDCFEYIKKLIEKQNLSIFLKGKLTNIEIREGIGPDNGKSVSISFRGMNPAEVKELILKNID